jgi:hypothetical protein
MQIMLDVADAKLFLQKLTLADYEISTNALECDGGIRTYFLWKA